MRSALLAILVVSACGYPPLDGNSGHPDGNTPHGDGDGSGSSDACQVPKTYGNATPSVQMAAYSAATSQTVAEYDYLGQLNNDAAPDYLLVQLVDTYPPFDNGVKAPAEISLTDNDANCGGCVLIEANCPNCFADSALPGSMYMANAGTLSVSQVGTTMSGSISNATFVHVTLASDNTTTVINDGCTTTIDSVAFSATVNQ